MTKLVNRAKMTTATVGTGSITLGSAVDGYQTFANAGVADADVVRYVIEDGDAWEIGLGTYAASGNTLTRTVNESSLGGVPIDLSGNAVVYVTAAAEDLREPIALAGAFSASIIIGPYYAPTSMPEGVFTGGQAVTAEDIAQFPVLASHVQTSLDFHQAFNFLEPYQQTITAGGTSSGDPQQAFQDAFFDLGQYISTGEISFFHSPWVGAASGSGSRVIIELPTALEVSHFLVLCDNYNIAQSPLWIDGQQVAGGAKTRLFTASNLPSSGNVRDGALNNDGVAHKIYTFEFGSWRAPRVFFIGLYPATSQTPTEQTKVVDTWSDNLPAITHPYYWYLKG